VAAPPSLDDRTYDELLAEARAVIPAHAPEWTDHNPSDPGIALLELFASIADMLMFRADQIPDRHVLAFLRLLRGPDWTPDLNRTADDQIGDALREVRERWRAVTPEDYEAIVLEAAPGRIARARCAPRRDLVLDPAGDAPGTVSVVVLPALDPIVLVGEEGAAVEVQPGDPPFKLPSDPKQFLRIGAASPFGGVRIALASAATGATLRVAYFDGTQYRVFGAEDGTEGLTRSGTISFAPPQGWAARTDEAPPRFWLRISPTDAIERPGTARRTTPVMPQPDAGLLTAVRDHIEPRRILTTRPVVVGASFAAVGFDVLVAPTAEADQATLRAGIADRLDAFLDPLTGGPAGGGWPLGRSVFLGELQQLIDGVPGVDHVPDVLATSPDATPLVHADGDPIGLDIGAGRLPDARVDAARIVVGASFITVRVSLSVQGAPSASAPTLRAAVKAAVRGFFHPLSGGPNGAATQRPVADLEGALRKLDGVAQVSAVLATEPDRIIYDSAGLQVLALGDGELVDVTTQIALS
jgi:predicted pyridoxine 5'-phosphate oxidase superfamily flavin-nucleotide-binding protein